ncbi:MAG: thiamine ABC transporter substrate binding subunit [Rhizobiaceae bacterium]|jgi:thiamine transport system substrate-binding protein|nr:thiamine ABC transporter substrate binding subunit [Rhizobiaceae bacterium]
MPGSRFVIATVLSLAASITHAAAQGVLTIYTYESFTAEWGPGPAVEQAFEAQCGGCDLRFVSVADGVALLNRVRIEGEATKADIVLGLDTNLTTEAAATGLFARHDQDVSKVTVPGGWTDRTFLPFDHGWFAVVYDTQAMANPPRSLKELVEGDPDQKIVIQDPRSSTPGLGLLLWVRHVYGNDAADAWRKLSRRVLTVTPGWSEAYGLFTQGEAPMVLSYTTSPAYHMIAEGTERYQAAAFAEGHYQQIEVAAQTVAGKRNPLAAQFLAFMLTPAFQDHIAEKNWMLPAAATSAPLNPVFDRLVKPETSLLFSPDEVAANRARWIEEWLGAFGR